MCTVALALAGVSAVGSGVADRQAKMAQWRAQKNAVDRSNAQAKLQYQNEIQISAYKDQRKSLEFEAALDAQVSARAALNKQLEINQQEATRASLANQLKLNEKITEAQFSDQKKLVESIKAQGTVLASGMQAGQSMMLELMDVERQLGMDQASTSASLLDANRTAAMTEYGIGLSQYSADARAVSGSGGGPTFGPSAEFQTIKPTKQSDPEKPSMLGSIMTGITTGVAVGAGVGHAKGADTAWWRTGS